MGLRTHAIYWLMNCEKQFGAFVDEALLLITKDGSIMNLVSAKANWCKVDV